MDKDKPFRQGPPAPDELERMRFYLRKNLSATIKKVNQVFEMYGVEVSPVGHISSTDLLGYYPIFQESHNPIFEETQLETKGIEAVVAKGKKGLKAELDKYVIGQDKAKKILAVEIIDHYRKILLEQEGKEVKRKKRNILLVGSTGVGKTYLIERLAEELNVPFAKVTATDYTTAGYVGGDVDDIVRQNLLRSAKGDIKLAEKGIIYIDEIDKISASAGGHGPDVGGDKVQSAILTLIDGKEVEAVNPQDREGRKDMAEKRHRGEEVPETINTKNILFILGGSFSSGKNGKSLLECVMERKNRESKNSEKITIGFGADLERERPIEHYDGVEVKSEDLVDYGIRQELIGRIPSRAILQDLTVDDMYNILKKDTEDSLVKQITAEFKVSGIKLDFTDDALHAMAEKSDPKTGARGLESVMVETLGEYLFELEGKELPLTVTREMVENPEAELKNLLKKLATEEKAKKTPKTIRESYSG